MKTKSPIRSRCQKVSGDAEEKTWDFLQLSMAQMLHWIGIFTKPFPLVNFVAIGR